MSAIQRLELSLKQKQILNITQEMRLRIELLQKNVLGLREMIIEQSQENPFLEIEQWGDEPDENDVPVGETLDGGDANTTLSGGSQETGEIDRPIGDTDQSATVTDILAAFDWDAYRDHSGNNFGETRVRRRNDDSEDFSWEDMLSEEEPVSRLLDVQIAASEYDDELKQVMTYLAYNLDERGFLREADEQLAIDLAVPVEQVATAREALRRFEPEGSASRDVADYLRFIFSGDPSGEVDPAAYDIVQRVVSAPGLIEMLTRKDFARLCNELGVEKPDLGAALALMKRIAPYPFFGYERFRTEHVIPDLRVYLVDREVVIEIERKFIPSVRLDRETYEREMARLRDRKKRDFLKERYRAAEWLVKSLSERNKTLYEVAASIFTFQRPFLEQGHEFLRSLTLKDVAEDIQRHQSTISRLTSGKYAVTPHGIFELKYFFVKKVNDESSATTTNRHLEARIEEIVAGEDKHHPLSDEDIARILSREGIAVARRTIAKYRAKLKMPAAQERRRDFEFRTEDQ